MIDIIIRAIIEFFFGVRVEGEVPAEPTFRTTVPEERVEFASWFHEMNFGKRLTNKPILW